MNHSVYPMPFRTQNFAFWIHFSFVLLIHTGVNYSCNLYNTYLELFFKREKKTKITGANSIIACVFLEVESSNLSFLHSFFFWNFLFVIFSSVFIQLQKCAMCSGFISSTYYFFQFKSLFCIPLFSYSTYYLSAPASCFL